VVQLTQHVAQRRAIIQLCDRFRINAVGNQRGADAVAGDIANHHIEVILVERCDQAEIAADRAHWVIERFDPYAAPNHGLRRETLLNARREHQIVFNLFLALFELRVRRAKVLFSGFLFGNVDERYDGEHSSIRVLDGSDAGDDRQTSASFCRQIKFKPSAARLPGLPALFFKDREIPGAVVEFRGIPAQDIGARYSGHLFENRVDE